jgi:hypothetical protein
MTQDPLAEGLVHFYSSQAELVLAQYENINQLLGPTTDWTHPGTHCEILLRDFLRRNLLQSMSVDKGYVFGRVQRGATDSHGPEIDILIHNTSDFRPVFRLEDFVIVQPEAVLGMIQVKRTFRTGKDGTLAKGLRQIVDAKQHLLDVLMQQRIRETTAAQRGDATLVKTTPQYPDMAPVFTALVSFEDETDKLPDTFRNVLLDAYRTNRSCVIPESRFDTSVYVLPSVVMSLKHVSLCCGRRDIAHQTYYFYESVSEGRNIGLQLLLERLTNAVFSISNKKPPFAFPETVSPVEVMQVPKANESLHTQMAP